MISKTSLQTIRALLELATLTVGETEGVERIAHKIRAPKNYLGKVLQRLARQGIVISQKGLNGGFRLGKTPGEIRLFDIVASLEDIQRWEGCFLGNSTCSESNACCVHQRWGKVRSAYIEFLKNTTIADLKIK